MKEILKRLTSYQHLSTEEAKQTLIKITKGEYTQSEVAKRLEINQVAVSRLEKKILKELKEKMTI